MDLGQSCALCGRNWHNNTTSIECAVTLTIHGGQRLAVAQTYVCTRCEEHRFAYGLAQQQLAAANNHIRHLRHLGRRWGPRERSRSRSVERTQVPTTEPRHRNETAAVAQQDGPATEDPEPWTFRNHNETACRLGHVNLHLRTGRAMGSTAITPGQRRHVCSDVHGPPPTDSSDEGA